jgi:hypothetical protein
MFRGRHLTWIVLLASCVTFAQDHAADSLQKSNGVPSEYVGNWVCQSVIPGYNLPGLTTPSSVVVVKFRLNADGTYAAANAKGHYSFNPAKKTIDWLDGLHHEQFSKTEVSRRSNGAPALSLIANQRYFGCFLAK